LGCFTGRDAEEGRLEEIDAFDQSSCPGVALAGFTAVWMIKKFRGPALRIDLGDGILPGIEQPPVSFHILRARKPAGCSDDRDRSVTHTLELIQGPWGEIGDEWQRHIRFITHKKSQMLGVP